MLLAGLDIGTTGCKITVFSERGEYRGQAYREYPADRTPSAHEIDPCAVWGAVRQVIGQAARAYPGIGAIGVTSFGETFVLLDERDKPLCPAMLYTDPRGGRECGELTERLGAEQIATIPGVRPHPMYTLPKLMWMRKNRPETYRRAQRALLMEDFVVYLLTGTAQIDYALATRTMAFDIQALTWSDSLLQAAEIDPRLFSTPVPTGTGAGPLRPALAAEWGMARDTVVVSVSHDQMAAAVGSAVFDDGIAVDGAGTVECITPVFAHADTADLTKNHYAVVPHVIPGRYVCYAFSYTGGALVKWFGDTLAGYAARMAEQRGQRLYSLLEDGWNGEPTGLLVLPHFAGAATPYMDTGSRGAVLGLSLSTSQEDLHLAILEGVCYEMRLNRDRMAGAGVAFHRLRATGGGANSRVWMQMKADILDIPVTALAVREAGATGSAMLAGVAAGVFSGLEEAAAAMVAERETYFPRPTARARYDVVYSRYEKLYDAVRPLMEGEKREK